MKKLTCNSLEKIEHIAFDFDGAFTDNCVITSSAGTAYTKFSRLDSIGLKNLEAAVERCLLVSKKTDKAESYRCPELFMKCEQAIEGSEKCIQQYCDLHDIKLQSYSFAEMRVN